MVYIDLEGHTDKSNGRRWIHTNKGFYEKFTFPKSINMGIMIIIWVPMKFY